MTEGASSEKSISAGSPLAGKRVVNTRALSQAGELDRLLEAHGAVPLSFPCIAIRPPADAGPLDAMVERLVEGGLAWVAFTSVNTVEALAGRVTNPHIDETARRSCRGALHGLPGLASELVDVEQQVSAPSYVGRHHTEGDQPTPTDRAGRRAGEPVKGSPTPTGTAGLRQPLSDCHPERSEGSLRSSPTKVAVVGRVTGEAVERLLGWPVAFTPAVERAADLGWTLPIAAGDRVLLPQSALAEPGLAAILSGRGARVTEVVAYEMVTGAGGVDLASLLAAGEVDAVCFTSGSTVRGCVERLGGIAIPDAVRVACIGTETAGVARSLGLRVDVVPDRPTARAMVEALATFFAMNDG